MVRLCLALIFALPAQAQGCALALLLAADVSLSVEYSEYRLQTGGIAQALRDPHVEAALLGSGAPVALAFMQWSGRTEQRIGPGWSLIGTRADLEAFAAAVERTPRAFGLRTAPGAALQAGLSAMATAPRCARYVTDISGDGIANDGPDVRAARDAHVALGYTINGLVILGDDDRTPDYYRHNIIGGPGHFMEIASGFDDYARAMRDKLLKELPPIVAGRLHGDAPAPILARPGTLLE